MRMTDVQKETIGYHLAYSFQVFQCTRLCHIEVFKDLKFKVTFNLACSTAKIWYMMLSKNKKISKELQNVHRQYNWMVYC